jgi:hypothetical protein
MSVDMMPIAPPSKKGLCLDCKAHKVSFPSARRCGGCCHYSECVEHRAEVALGNKMKETHQCPGGCECTDLATCPTANTCVLPAVNFNHVLTIASNRNKHKEQAKTKRDKMHPDGFVAAPKELRKMEEWNKYINEKIDPVRAAELKKQAAKEPAAPISNGYNVTFDEARLAITGAINKNDERKEEKEKRGLKRSALESPVSATATKKLKVCSVFGEGWTVLVH